MNAVIGRGPLTRTGSRKGGHVVAKIKTEISEPNPGRLDPMTPAAPEPGEYYSLVSSIQSDGQRSRGLRLEDPNGGRVRCLLAMLDADSGWEDCQLVRSSFNSETLDNCGSSRAH